MADGQITKITRAGTHSGPPVNKITNGEVSVLTLGIAVILYILFMVFIYIGIFHLSDYWGREDEYRMERKTDLLLP